MDAVVEAERGQLGDLQLQLGQLADERAPVVDRQEDLAVAAEVGTVAAAGVPGGHGVDAQLAELVLALDEQRSQLPDETADPVVLAGPADGADVRQVPQPMEEPAAKVHGVDLDLAGRVGGRQRRHQGAEQRALAAPRRPHDHEVARALGQVEHERSLVLVDRAVDHADRHP
jgi:hypothetical protein